MQAGYIQSTRYAVSVRAIAICLAALSGCQKPTPSSAATSTENSKPAAGTRLTQPDASSGRSDDSNTEYEALVRHLLRRLDDADQAISDLKKERDKEENRYLDEEFAILRGESIAKPDPAESQQRMARDIKDAAERATQHALDVEESIELHNRLHPESPEASLNDLLRLECGDCQKERARRNAQFTAEAAHASTKP